MVKKDHPFWHLTSQLLPTRANLNFEFSRYVYREYGITESRDILNVSADSLNENWLNEEIANLDRDEELALHSRVIYETKVFHIPMIDFQNTVSHEMIQTRIKHISQRIDDDIWIYNSGRSLHGYYFLLMEESHWVEFLGSLLLCNSRGEFPYEIVDARWIGHSLEHGFSALRWSQNTERHQTMPYLVEGSYSYQQLPR